MAPEQEQGTDGNKDKEQGTGDPQSGGTGNDGGASPSSTGGATDEVANLRKEIEDLKKQLTSRQGESAPITARIRDIEAEAERMVRDAQQRLDRERKIDGALEKIEAVTEKAPKKVRRLTKVLWGGGDE